MSAADKTTAILVLAEALQAATSVGNPAPIVRRLGEWMRAPLKVGDVVVEMTTKHRGPSPSRVGEVVNIDPGSARYDDVTEILMLDPPCGNEECQDRTCIHRYRWSNASFVRVPVTPSQLAEALDLPGPRGAGFDRAGLVALLADRGIGVREP